MKSKFVLKSHQPYLGEIVRRGKKKSIHFSTIFANKLCILFQYIYTCTHTLFYSIVIYLCLIFEWTLIQFLRTTITFIALNLYLHTHTHTHKHAHTHTLTSLRSSKYTEIPILKYLAIIFYNIYNLISFCLIYLISDFIRTCYFVHNEFTFTWISVSPFYLYYLQYVSALSLPWNTLSYEFYDIPLQSWTTICKLLAGIILVLMKCETSFLKQ